MTGPIDAGGGLGGRATPSFVVPEGASDGLAPSPPPLQIRGSRFVWGSRTYLMGILNVTPDSFSGDGLIATPGDRGAARPPGPPRGLVDRAVQIAAQMAADGADIIDVGGESTRPGHDPVEAAEERRRVVPVIRAIRAALPGLPISVDTSKVGVAVAALDAGADLVNDVWGVAAEPDLLTLVAERGVPLVLMHNRSEARYGAFFAEVIADLQRAVERAAAAGVLPERLLIDPGFGFGKTPVHNLALLDGLGWLRVLGRPILLGASRKSTLGLVLDLPPEERLEATLATTALAIRAGVDMVRVHDVRANVRVARMADAVVRSPSGGRT